MATQSIPLTDHVADVRKALARFPLWFYLAAAAVVIASLIAAFIASRAQSAPMVETSPVVRQTLSSTVTASGIVNAQNSVSVGTQVSGTISALYVDFNSRVRRGQILARLDPSTVQAQLDQARANLAQAQAQAAAANANAGGAESNIAVASANSQAQSAAIGAAYGNVAKSQAALTLAQQQLTRDQALLNQGFIAQASVDTDLSNVGQAQAALAAAQASMAQVRAQAQASSASVNQATQTAAGQADSAQAAQASVAAAQAQVQLDAVNLDHTIITSPVDGTVVARAVSVGQTVAASFNTPTLFTIAQDLRKMEVDINVAEPDIGNVKAGNAVDFSVLAYPNRVFHGTVREVRINPQTLNNVVTYQVIVDVPNNDSALLPGMTANATITVASAKYALVVPINALRTHAAQQPQPQAQATTQPSAGASPWGAVATGGETSVTAGQNAILLVSRDGKVQPVRVHVDLTTAALAAVTPRAGSTLSVGDLAVTRITQRTRQNTVTRSPLLPGGRGAH